MVCPPRSTLISRSSFDSLESGFEGFSFFFFQASFAKIPSDLLSHIFQTFPDFPIPYYLHTDTLLLSPLPSLLGHCSGRALFCEW